MAEFHQTVLVGDQTHELPLVQVVRVRDGQIVSFRDYMDYIRLGRATAATPELRAALLGPPAHEIENRSAER